MKTKYKYLSIAGYYLDTSMIYDLIHMLSEDHKRIVLVSFVVKMLRKHPDYTKEFRAHVKVCSEALNITGGTDENTR